jgi:hypothetical protein
MLPSWEVPPAFGDDFDDFADAGFNDVDEDRDPALIPPPTREEGAQGFAEFLVDQYMSGAMSAKLVCVLSWWATLSGAEGMVNEMALKPSSSTGHFARHMKKILRVDDLETRHMHIDVPGSDKHSFDLGVFKTPVIPPHEALHAEIVDKPEIHDMLAEAIRTDVLPPMYYQHPVVKASGGKAVPLMLYADGVPVTKNESVLGFWTYNILTMNRHLVCCIRKSRMCSCGCKGWCTLWAVFNWLQWSCMAMALGFSRPRGLTITADMSNKTETAPF